MKSSGDLQQEIAVFGESGSGKTVMLSSFFGASQEPEFRQSSLYRVVAESAHQRDRLHQNYLGMRDDGRRPEPTRFTSEPFRFRVKVNPPEEVPKGRRNYEALQLLWHDYPGEWFEQDVSGPEEARDRAATFTSLLGADVALLLVDGQKLLDHAGEEDRYLKKLLRNFRGMLESIEDDLTRGGKLVEFPRIWILTLSKADLLPQLDAYRFRDLIRRTVTDDLNELRKVLESIIEGSDVLSIGEDFLVLSSARFDADRIDVADRVGLDLVLPVAAAFPMERHLQWLERKQIIPGVAESLLKRDDAVAEAMVGVQTVGRIAGRLTRFPKLAKIGKLITSSASSGSTGGAALVGIAAFEALQAAGRLAGTQLAKRNREARSHQDYMSAVLTGFKLDLESGEEHRVLLRGDG
jgi:hypothetical protein